MIAIFLRNRLSRLVQPGKEWLETPSYRWVILTCGVLAYGSAYLTRWSYTGLAPYMSEDLRLDKAALGMLGGAFFYSYALAQIPWGAMTDRFGGRKLISLGVVGSACGLALFATAHTLETALLWRLAIGLVSASAFVPIAALVAQWFPPKERGLANGVYYGLGGGLGQGAAFLLLPALQIVFFQEAGSGSAGWRWATVVVAALLLIVGGVCFIYLRSFPPNRRQVSTDPLLAPPEGLTSLPLDPPPSPSHRFLRDPTLWLLGAYFSAGIVVLRLVPGWITIFSGDLARTAWGYTLETSVMIGGTIGLLYTIGHVAGSPLVGRLSDGLLTTGLNRMTIAAAGLGGGGLVLLVFTQPWLSPALLCAAALILGVALHTFPVLNAAIAERWGAHRVGECLGWINMIGQLAGATALSASGFAAAAFSTADADPLGEYRGIWYLAIAACVFGASSGMLAAYASRRSGN